MPLKHRCPQCRHFLSISLKACPRCDIPTLELWLTSQISGQRFFKRIPEGTTLNYANLLLKRWISELKEPPPPSSPLFADIADRYVNKLIAQKKRYAYEARLFLDRWKERLGPVNIGQIKVSEIQDFQHFLLNAGLSKAYCNRHVQVAKAAWYYSLRGTPNPFAQVKLFAENNELVRWLSPDEESALLEAAGRVHRAPAHFGTIILLAIHTSLRMRNILHLQVSEVDFVNGLITIRQKGDREHTVPMNQTVYNALKEIAPEGVYFFPSPYKRNAPVDEVKKSFRNAKKLAGITRPFRFHDLRHHGATRMLRNTGNLAVVSKVLGHSDMRVTQKYAHVLMEDMREAVDSLVAVTDNNQAHHPPQNIPE